MLAASHNDGAGVGALLECRHRLVSLDLSGCSLLAEDFEGLRMSASLNQQLTTLQLYCNEALPCLDPIVRLLEANREKRSQLHRDMRANKVRRVASAIASGVDLLSPTDPPWSVPLTHLCAQRSPRALQLLQETLEGRAQFGMLDATGVTAESIARSYASK